MKLLLKSKERMQSMRPPNGRILRLLYPEQLFHKTLSLLIYPEQLVHKTLSLLKYSLQHGAGVQPKIFQGRWSFVELRHFDKLFPKNTRKKLPRGKILGYFLLVTLKTTFLMEDLIQVWTKLGYVVPKIRALFSILK